MLETSDAIDKVKALEAKVVQLRERADQEAARLSGVERAVEAARQGSTQPRETVTQNQILIEQFDTVMPLLKELYKRLRPHADWTEIESGLWGEGSGVSEFCRRGRLQSSIPFQQRTTAVRPDWLFCSRFIFQGHGAAGGRYFLMTQCNI